MGRQDDRLVEPVGLLSPLPHQTFTISLINRQVLNTKPSEFRKPQEDSVYAQLCAEFDDDAESSSDEE